MKVKKLLVAMALLAGSAAAHAATYGVAAEFKETLTNGVDTFFNGSFDWDGVSVTNLHGTMNSSMYSVNNVNPNYKTSFPLMNLTYQLDGTHVDGNIVTASVFLKNTTDVYRGGGYDGTTPAAGRYAIKYGGSWGPLPKLPNEPPNENAFFKLVFDKETMQGVVDQMVYGDCTRGGLMRDACMAGEITGSSAMYGTPLLLNIALVPVQTVPLPAAAWLFLTALMGYLGLQRRRQSP